MKRRHIYIGISSAREAVQSKDRLEAFSFALMVKLLFKSSRINNASVRRCKEIFRIGSTRMCRVLSNAEKYGYIARENSSIVAFPIKDIQAYNVKYEVENTLVSETGLVETSIRLKDAMDIVRKCVLLDHIGRMNDTEKTIKSVECAKSVSAYRKAKRKLQRLSPKGYSSNDKGLSNTAAAKVINSNHYRARLLLQSITAQNLVTRSIRRIPTGLDANTFDAGINSYIRKYGIGGYLYRSADGKIYERRSDKFVINDLSMFAYVK